MEDEFDDETLSKYPKVGKYALIRTIGAGSYAKVKLGVSCETHEQVAVKVIDKTRVDASSIQDQLKREITAMKLIKHESVVEIKEVLATKSRIFIVMELVKGGDLLDKIEQAGYFDEETAMYYFEQMLAATEVCHQHDICHRDLKPENMLLTPDLRLKITDFGMSVLNDHNPSGESGTVLLDTICGTPNYVAPEVIQGKGYDGKLADIWSLGCILFVMMAGALPFDGPKAQMFHDIKNGKHAPFPSQIGSGARGLIDKILTVDPTKRPTIAQIRGEKYFQKFQKNDATSAEPAKARSRFHMKIDFKPLLSRTTKDKGPTLKDQPPTKTIFEVVTISLGFDMSGSLDKEVTSSEISTVPVRTVQRFATTHDPNVVFDLLTEVFSEIGVEVLRAVHATFKVKGEIHKGVINPIKFVTRIVQLFPGTDTMSGVCMVETHKTSGSTKRFSEFYSLFLSHAKMTPIISKKP